MATITAQSEYSLSLAGPPISDAVNCLRKQPPNGVEMSRPASQD